MINPSELPSGNFDKKLTMEFDMSVELDDIERAKRALAKDTVPGPLLQEATLPSGVADLILLGAVLQRDMLEGAYQEATAEQRLHLADRLDYQEARIIDYKRQMGLIPDGREPS